MKKPYRSSWKIWKKEFSQDKELQEIIGYDLWFVIDNINLSLIFLQFEQFEKFANQTYNTFSTFRIL